jgi:hypothetical protein
MRVIFGEELEFGWATPTVRYFTIRNNQRKQTHFPGGGLGEDRKQFAGMFLYRSRDGSQFG